MRTLFSLALLVMLSACAGTPARYYSLMPMHQAASSLDRQTAGYAVRVDPVRVPAQVDRLQLVVRQDAGPGVLVLNQSLWAAPLADGIRGALARELSQRLSAADATYLPAPGGADVWELGVEVRRFDLMEGAWTELDLNWSLKSDARPDATSMICHAVIRRPVQAPGVAPLVESQREALQQFADTVAAAIRSNAAGSGTNHPAIIGCT
ncbi:MAG: PqiC family protein [Alcaligenaceae bacterium]|nr:PqiC family protein [Alcaligenaceae bacterium]